MMATPAAPRASIRAVSDETLARSSAAAVDGRVVATESRWDAGADAIYTFVTIDVARSWGLPGSPSRVVVKQLGGQVDDIALVVGGQAHFETGEDVLVFLDVRPRDGTLSVAGLEQGKWTLSESAPPAMAANRQTHGHDATEIVDREYRSADYLHTLVALVGSRASAARAVLEPAVPVASAAPRPGRGSVGPAFTFLTSTPARWHHADTSTPVYVDPEVGGHPMFGDGGLPQVLNALAQWNSGGSLRLRRGVERGPRCFINDDMDGRISIAYRDPCGEIANASTVLAIGGVYYSSNDVRTVGGRTFGKVVRGMVVVDDNPLKFSGFSTGCFQDLITHELGHAIGFGHTSSRPAVMAPAIPASCFSRETGMALQSDDLAAVAAAYPGTGEAAPAPTPSLPPNTPTGLVASVVGSTVTINWNAPTAGSVPTSYRLYVGLAPGAATFGPFNATTTTMQTANVASGVYYVRVVAINASGTSAPTSDVPIHVGMSQPPSAPVNLTATASPGGTVSLSWQAPMSGVVTGYRLIAGTSPGASTFQIPVSGTTYRADGVPSGTYYLRVAALNGASMSPSCTEVTVVVP